MPCFLSQASLPIRQPPVSLLLPRLQRVACLGSRLGNGVPGLFLLASHSQSFAARWVWVLMGRAWGMQPDPSWPMTLLHKLGHNYVVDVLQPVLAGPRSPGTEPSAENSSPPGRNPEGFEESRNPSSLTPSPYTHTHTVFAFPGICSPPRLQHHTTPAQTPALIPSLFYLLHKHHHNRSNINQK